MESNKLFKSLAASSILVVFITFQASAAAHLPTGCQLDVIGTHYQLNKTVALDAGWMHMSIQDEPNDTFGIDNFAHQLRTVGAQLTWKV